MNADNYLIKNRLGILAAGLSFMAVGLGSRYGLSGFWAKYLGLGLWAGFVYSLVVLVKPSTRIVYSSAVALIVCWSVEFFQLTPVPAYLSSKHIILRLIWGTTFSVWDLPTYAAGIGLGAGVHSLIRRLPGA
jgi:hypothetical protein